MRKSRHTLARFEEHSLALFTVLVMATTGVAAQTREPSSPTADHFVQVQVPAAKPVLQRTARQPGAEQAFGRADTNGDGQLSREEAQRLPAVWERFDAIDADGDHLISRDEFHRGIAN